MRHPAMMVLLLVLVSTGCTRPELSNSPESSAPSPVPRSSPTPVLASDIQFVLNDAYPVGDRVVVKIENVGNVTYTYQFTYQACSLSYSDAQGRKFIIPPGTHCDILGKAPIKPGETKKLFTWDLDECVKDRWGCVKSQPLDPGTYTIRGAFQAVGGGDSARAEATLEIQES